MSRLERVLIGALAFAIGWFYVWTVRSSGEPWKFGREQADYYNRLIDGWLDGQLHMKVEVPDALLKLKDPYDPEQRPPGLGLHDASFRNGKYYLYFGAAPMVVLMLPFRLSTGVDLPLAVAVLVFTYGGFLASAALWLLIRRRYFPDTGTGVALAGVLALGLAGLGPMLLRRPHMWELPIGAGYCFAMLTLLCVWRSLHSERRRMIWFAAAGLSLALAIASRPTYLLASPLLAVPLLLWWRDERRVPWRLALNAAVPLVFVGSLMALHNYARFGNPLEFGQSYQFSLDYESKVSHFSTRYVGFNAWRYFFSPAQWSPYFPFIHPAELPPKPEGFSGHDDVYGVLVNLPLAWLALAAPLGLWRRDPVERRRLGAWLAAVAVLFVVMAGVLVCFFGSLARYQMDFTPALMLLAVVGVLALERWVGACAPRAVERALRALWVGAAVFSAVFAVVFSLQFDGLLRERNPARERDVARTLNRIPAVFQRAMGVKHGAVELTVRLRPLESGDHVLMTVGDPPRIDRVFVRHLDAERVQFGVAQDDAPEIVSRPLPIDFERAHEIRVSLGSLWPPITHPLFEYKSAADVARITSEVRIELDGETVIEERRRVDAGGGKLRVGSAAMPGPGGHFGAERVRMRRGVAANSAGAEAATGFVRFRVSFPERPVMPREPLVGLGNLTAGAVIFVHFVDDSGQLAFGTSARGDRRTASGALHVDVMKVHEVLARWWPAQEEARRKVEVRLNGTIAFSDEVPWLTHEAALAPGKNVSDEPGIAPEFTGRIHSVQRSADGRDPLLGSGDTVKLRVRLPRGRAGHREPLVVTGRHGAGDLLSIEYVDEQTVRFAFDHWYTPGKVSGPVRVDFARPQEIEVMMSSLAADGSNGRATRRGRLRVTMNGTQAWEETALFFAAEPHEVAIGRNPIGGTSCGPLFTGDVLLAERMAP